LGFIILAKRQDFNRLALAFRLCFLSPLHLALLLEHGNLRLAETPKLSYLIAELSYRLFIWHSFWNLVIYALLRFHSLTLRGRIFTIVFGKKGFQPARLHKWCKGLHLPWVPSSPALRGEMRILMKNGSQPARPYGVQMALSWVSTSPALQGTNGALLGLNQPSPTRCKWRFLGSQPAQPYKVQMALSWVSTSPALQVYCFLIRRLWISSFSVLI
jgi:hypothetical protein